jgi:predicted AAA+ superfamily ATPase
MAEISELLRMYNPWWKKKYSSNLHKRTILAELSRYMKEKQILALNGLRRAGKTSVMRLLIEDLLSRTDEKNIMFFSFDGSTKKADFLEDVVREYERLLEPRGKKYLFFDEVQFIDGWEWAVKRLYDLGQYKIIISGSSSFSVKKSIGKAFVGRAYDFTIKPFSLREILEMGGTHVPDLKFSELLSKDAKSLEKDFFLLKEKASAASLRYIKKGGLPETIGMDEDKYLRYVKDSVVDKLIFRDLGETMGLRESAKVRELFVSLCEHPGFLLDIQSSANKLDLSRKTVVNYLEHLKSVYLIKEVYNYTGRLSKSLRKGKRYYLCDNSLTAYAPAIKHNEGRLAENAAIISSNSEYFWRERDKEVDMIMESNNKPVPVEIKYRSEIAQKNLEGVFSFGNKFGVGKALIITKNELSEKNVESYGRKMHLKYIPLWLFLLAK